MKFRTERIWFYIFCVLAAAPLLLSHYPPMIDLPQHAAQISTFNRLDSPDFLYSGLYYLNWSTPYLGGYFILWCLSQFMSVLTGAKILVAAAVIVIPIAASRLRAYFNGAPEWDWLMLPIGYGFAFQWGLFNFLLGVPIALTFLLYVFRYAEKPTLRTGCWMAVFSLLLYPVHLLIAAFCCGLAMLYILASTLTTKTKWIALLPFISPPLIGVIWTLTNVASGGQAAESGPWDLSIYRPVEFLASAIGTYPRNILNMLVGAVIFSLPFLNGAKFTRNKSRLIILCALLFWMMLGPNYFFGNYFTYNRFAVFGLPLFIIALTPSTHNTRSNSRALRSLFFILPVALILATCLRFAAFDKESRGYSDIAQVMQPNKRVVTLMFNHRSIPFHLPMYLHFPAWYQAESTGIVDFSFSQFGVLVSYKPEAGVPFRRGFEWQPESFNWQNNQAWLYDYFVVRYERDLGPILFSGAECPVRLVAHSGVWWLYENQSGFKGNHKNDASTLCTTQ